MDSNDAEHHVAPGTAARERDPVCGMAVDPSTAARKFEHAGRLYYFCSDHCQRKFVSEPSRYLDDADIHRGGDARAHYDHHASPVAITRAPSSPPNGGESALYTCPMHPEVIRDRPGPCPICGMALEPLIATGDEDNAEFEDMFRRFLASLVLTLPVLALAMGEMVPALRRLISPDASAWVQLA